MSAFEVWRKIHEEMKSVEHQLALKRYGPAAHLVPESEDELVARLTELQAAADAALAQQLTPLSRLRDVSKSIRMDDDSKDDPKKG